MIAGDAFRFISQYSPLSREITGYPNTKYGNQRHIAPITPIHTHGMHPDYGQVAMFHGDTSMVKQHHHPNRATGGNTIFEDDSIHGNMERIEDGGKRRMTRNAQKRLIAEDGTRLEFIVVV